VLKRVSTFSGAFSALLLVLGAVHFSSIGSSAAERIELAGLQNQFAPASSSQPPNELGKTISFAAGLDDASELSFVGGSQAQSNINHLHYEQLFHGVPVWGERVTVSRNTGNEIVRTAGAVMRGLALDVPDTNVAISGQQAMRRAKGAVREGQSAIGGDLRSENENVRLVIYVRPEDKKAFLSYEVSFFAVTDVSTGKATRPFFLIDAKTGDMLHRYEGLTYELGTGPGGNVRTGKYYYGRDGIASFEVTPAGANCRLETKDVITINLNNETSATDSPFEFRCGENTFREVNGGFAPLNDAHHFASIAIKMYRDWYGLNLLNGKALVRVHYAQRYENAFWNGKYVTFGDGADTLYPLVTVELVAHELSHGFTEQHSQLIYAGQPGAISEAFSDMAGEAAKSFASNGQPPDFLVGSRAMKGGGNRAIRYLCDPRRDGRSIDHSRDFRPDLNVHFGSGVYNKAFCLLAKTPGWDARKAFGVFLAANRDYWAPNTDFISGARDVLHAASDAGYSTSGVKAAFESVGISIEDTPQSAWEPASGSTHLAQSSPEHRSKAAEVEAGAAGDEKPIVGDWMVPESGFTLSIKSGEWFHPRYGRARIREATDDADIKVFYVDRNVRCSYRVIFSDTAKTLSLVATDPMQDPEYCPAGRLNRIGHKQSNGH
jgi:vibriolysin